MTANSLFLPARKADAWDALPVLDTVALVRDPADSTKRMRIDVGALSTGTTRVLTMPDQNVDLTPNSGTYPAATHATRHQHGGADEIATATAGANAIPKAGSGGTLATGWFPTALAAIGALTPAADRVPYYTSSSAAALATLTSYARTLLDDADAATAATTLGLGTGNSPVFTNIDLTGLTDGYLVRVGSGALANSAVQGDGTNVSIGASPASGTRLYINAGAGTPLLVSTNGTGANHVVMEDLSDAAAPSTARPYSVFRHNAGLGSLSHANRSAGGATTSTRICIAWDENQNILIGPSPARPTAGAGSLIISQTSTAPTPASNQGAIYVRDNAGNARVYGKDEAGTEYALTSHPNEIMEAHSALMASVGLSPLRLTWGSASEQTDLGIKTLADVGAALRCVEYLMAQAGKPITLITETDIPRGPSWSDRQLTAAGEHQTQVEDFDGQVDAWREAVAAENAKPFWARREVSFSGKNPGTFTQKPEPAWLAAARQN